jgi:uracil-DNA glycosylase family 4
MKAKEEIDLTETHRARIYEQCQKCFSPNEHRAITYPCGPSHCDVMIIGQAPSFDASLPTPRDTLKCSKTAKLLRKLLGEIDQDIDHFYFTNLVKCSGLLQRKEGSQANCFEKLCKEIGEVEPKKVITLGTKVKKFLEKKQDFVDRYRIRFIFHPAQRKISRASYREWLRKELETCCS